METHRNLKITARITVIVALLASLIAFLPSAMVSAATITLNPGDSIQDAIDAASPGDVIELTAGTYTENFALVNVDGLTIRGLGNVEILTQGATSGIRMVSASNIVLENLTLNGESPTTPQATGVDLNSSQNVTFRNMTVRNQDRNGIAVNAQYDAGYTPQRMSLLKMSVL